MVNIPRMFRRKYSPISSRGFFLQYHFVGIEATNMQTANSILRLSRAEDVLRESLSVAIDFHPVQLRTFFCPDYVVEITRSRGAKLYAPLKTT